MLFPKVGWRQGLCFVLSGGVLGGICLERGEGDYSDFLLKGSGSWGNKMAARRRPFFFTSRSRRTKRSKMMCSPERLLDRQLPCTAACALYSIALGQAEVLGVEYQL